MLIVAVVIVFSITVRIIGGIMSPQAGLAGAIAAPFQRLGTTIKNSFEDVGKRWSKGDELARENDQLKKQINELTEQLVDYQTVLGENEFYKDYLEIKDSNPDFVFCPAMKIAGDPDDPFGGFVIDVGTHDGVALYDPVITDAGLVGYITETAFSTAKVTTILNPELNCGAYDTRTDDAGAVAGTRELAVAGKTRLYNLPRSCSVTVGDIIVTSGSGIFPDKLIIGRVENIQNDPISSSLYAEITPSVNFDELRNVMVLTSFDGQGNGLIGNGD